MFTAVDQLPPVARKLLEKSWAQTFYNDYFCKIDERVLSVLYSDKKSRPNIPVNILVGFETIKSWFGWSDEKLYNHFLFVLQVFQYPQLQVHLIDVVVQTFSAFYLSPKQRIFVI